MIDFSKYVGIPFLWNSYDKRGTFCWGLLWQVQNEVFDRKLPKLPFFKSRDIANQEKTAFVWATSHIEAQKIWLSEAQSGDVVVMKGAMNGIRTHVGTFTDDKRVLHIEEGSSSMIERIDSARFKWRQPIAYRLLSK